MNGARDHDVGLTGKDTLPSNGKPAMHESSAVFSAITYALPSEGAVFHAAGSIDVVRHVRFLSPLLS